jgi:hypothetical protein
MHEESQPKQIVELGKSKKKRRRNYMKNNKSKQKKG